MTAKASVALQSIGTRPYYSFDLDWKKRTIWTSESSSPIAIDRWVIAPISRPVSTLLPEARCTSQSPFPLAQIPTNRHWMIDYTIWWWEISDIRHEEEIVWMSCGASMVPIGVNSLRFRSSLQCFGTYRRCITLRIDRPGSWRETFSRGFGPDIQRACQAIQTFLLLLKHNQSSNSYSCARRDAYHIQIVPDIPITSGTETFRLWKWHKPAWYDIRRLILEGWKSVIEHCHFVSFQWT